MYLCECLEDLVMDPARYFAGHPHLVNGERS